jgi:uncharacterized membrane protein YgdD (TMEM256/DUF423 family)
VGAPSDRRETVTYQRRATAQIVVGSLLLFPVSLFYLVQEGELAITPLSIVGGVVLVVGLVKRGRDPWMHLTFHPYGPT